MTRLSPYLFATALLYASVVGCKKPQRADVAGEPSARRATTTQFAPVVIKNLSPSMILSGALAADEQSQVATQTAGAVVSVAVDVGTRVKKGDPLVVLDKRDAALRLAQAEAQVTQAIARLAIPPGERFDVAKVPDVRAAREAMDLAVSDAERNRGLFASGTISQAQWDAIRIRADQARAQHDAAVAGARQIYASVASAQAAASIASKALADSTIRAPFDGSVVDRLVSPGEFASVGRTVVVLVRDNPLRLKVDVPEADLSRIELGRTVEVSVSAYPDQVFPGTLKRISSALRPQTRMLPIEAEVPNDKGVLKPGLFATVRITIPGPDQPAYFVPLAAIATNGSGTSVYIRQGNKVVERLVRTGRRQEGLIEVVGGFSPGEEVAISLVDKLSDGADIIPQ